MANILNDLDDYVVTDSGEVGARESLLIDHLKNGHTLRGVKAVPGACVETYNRRRDPAHRIPIIELNDEIDGVPPDAFDWQLPPQYLTLDLVEYLTVRLCERFPHPPEAYQTRLTEEVAMMEDRQMGDLIRTLIYMIDTFAANNVVHGVGRGSSCASLVLYLIGVHQVDPIEFDIPITEFLR